MHFCPELPRGCQHVGSLTHQNHSGHRQISTLNALCCNVGLRMSWRHGMHAWQGIGGMGRMRLDFEVSKDVLELECMHNIQLLNLLAAHSTCTHCMRLSPQAVVQPEDADCRHVPSATEPAAHCIGTCMYACLAWTSQ
eukprot:scpid57728/ scgid2536/ 